MGLPQRDMKLNLSTLLILVLMALILVQAVGLVFNWTDFGQAIKLGPVFILLAVLMTSATSVAVFRRLIQGYMVSKQDIFAIVVTAIIALFMLFFFREAVPEVFEQALLQLQSMLGF